MTIEQLILRIKELDEWVKEGSPLKDLVDDYDLLALLNEAKLHLERLADLLE